MAGVQSPSKSDGGSERGHEDRGKDEGVHEVRYARDEYANIKAVAYFDLEGQKCNNKNTAGYHRAELIYNNLKERVQFVKYNTEDELIEE